MIQSRDIRLQTQPRRGLRRVEAAIYVGVSPTKFDEFVQRGTFPKPMRLDRITLWDLRRLDHALDALSASEDEAKNPWD